MPVTGSALPGIEAERVGRWLAEHVDGLAGPVEFGLVSGGRSNLTYRVTDARRAACARPAAAGLGDMVRTTGYVERQLRRWHAQVHATGAPELPLLDEVHDLLARRIPAQATGIVHGDYRAGNIAFGPDGAVLAVFDWELATSGDPMADLGWLAATWQDPDEPLPPAMPGPSTVAGFPARGATRRPLRPAVGPGRVGPAVLGGVRALAVGLHRRRRAGPLPGRAHGRRRVRRQAQNIG